MAPLTEGKTPGDFMLFEENSHYSREEVTIASGADLEPGTVLGQITTGGKYIACDHAAVGGSQVAKAVLYMPAAAASADVNAVVIARHATVRRLGLTFDANFTTSTQRDGAVAELKAVGILAS